jgi:hypothetical protein
MPCKKRRADLLAQASLPVILSVHRLEADATLRSAEDSARRRIAHELTSGDTAYINKSMRRVWANHEAGRAAPPCVRIPTRRGRAVLASFVFLDGRAN